MSEQNETDSFPTAILKPRESLWNTLLRQSRMWWVTLGCLIIAVGLTWWSMEKTGPEITIRFPEGHGLKVGDTLRYRGIEAGQVTAVHLNEDLSGVEVSVTLTSTSAVLAREGSRFWIVRPQLSLSGVSGLETAVGAKYLGVSPGDIDQPKQLHFDGLATAPADIYGEGGIEIILRGDERYSLSPGSPVTWRGVEVGRVLSVDLSPDTRYVDVRSRIDAAYSRLLKSNSRFWITSGFGVDAGIGGIKLKAESLATIARGGVAFITPGEDAEATSVSTGHVFPLLQEAPKDWTETTSTRLFDFELPPTVSLKSQWKQKQFGLTRDRERFFQGVLISENDSYRLLVPTEGGTVPAAALDKSWSLGIKTGVSDEDVFQLPTEIQKSTTEAGLSLYELKTIPERLRESALRGHRVVENPEDCCLVRTVRKGAGTDSLLYSLPRQTLLPQEGRWRVEGTEDLEDWHGAAVLSAQDGLLIGQFVTAPQGPAVIPLTNGLFN